MALEHTGGGGAENVVLDPRSSSGPSASATQEDVTSIGDVNMSEPNLESKIEAAAEVQKNDVDMKNSELNTAEDEESDEDEETLSDEDEERLFAKMEKFDSERMLVIEQFCTELKEKSHGLMKHLELDVDTSIKTPEEHSLQAYLYKSSSICAGELCVMAAWTGYKSSTSDALVASNGTVQMPQESLEALCLFWAQSPEDWMVAIVYALLYPSPTLYLALESTLTLYLLQKFGKIDLQDVQLYHFQSDWDEAAQAFLVYQLPYEEKYTWDKLRRGPFIPIEKIESMFSLFPFETDSPICVHLHYLQRQPGNPKKRKSPFICDLITIMRH